MRRLACALFLAASLNLIGPAPSSAQTDDDGYNWAPYAAVSMGGIWPDLELTEPKSGPDYPFTPVQSRVPDTFMYFGVEAAAAVGLDMPWLRWDVAEFAYNWSNSNISGVEGSTSQISLGTGFRVGPFRQGLPVVPYLSLGFAGGRISTEGVGTFSSFSDWGFQWNAGLGVEMYVLDRLRAGLRFRYRSTSIETTALNGLGTYEVEMNLYTLSLELVY